MLKIKQERIEKIYDYLDDAALLIYEKARKDYLEGLLLASDYILGKPLERLDEEILAELETLYDMIADITFNREEIRKAFQLCLLKGFKHQNQSLSDITPDTIGMLFSYFVDLFYKNKQTINILDATVGTGNLLLTMMNNSNIEFNNIYGIDEKQNYLNTALHLADLMEYKIEFLNQNNLTKLFVPPVDIIIGDLPFGDEENADQLSLECVKHDIRYKSYLMVENLMKYTKPGGFFIYLIPNDFFIHNNNEVMKEIILRDCYIQAIIELPESMFKEEQFRKSILILRKKAETISYTEILMLKFPDFNDQTKVMNAIDKINQWFINIQ